MMKTSGLLFALNPDGSADIGHEDYDVKIFDGADYEVMYHLDENNFELLLDSLGISKEDDIKSHLIDTFDKNFDSAKFENFCKEKNIISKRNIHIG